MLPDHEIESLALDGMIAPYRSANLQPSSIDLTLSTSFRVFLTHEREAIDLDDPHDITVPITTDRLVLHPNEFVLGATEEHIVMPSNVVGRVDGKSSLGRLGLLVHATAGFVDPGFRGPLTLEMSNLMPVPLILRSGKLICQLTFHKLNSPPLKTYDGRYQDSKGVVASRYGSDERGSQWPDPDERYDGGRLTS